MALAPALWNSLPLTIKNISFLYTLKKKLEGISFLAVVLEFSLFANANELYNVKCKEKQIVIIMHHTNLML